MSQPIEKVNLAAAFARFHEHWSPKIVGEVNESLVKLVKFKGDFVWHHHDHEDEMFLVIRGRLRMNLRERSIDVGEGEFIIIPRGVEHKPFAQEECWVMLFEPRTTLNTGNVTNARTRVELERL